MEMQNQVCSWEQGLRLHKLGVIRNKSFFQWMEVVIGGNDEKAWALFRPNTGEYDWMAVTSIHPDVDGEDFETERECSAFTVAELAVMLPYKFLNMAALHDDDHLQRNQFYYGFWKTNQQWSFRFEDYEPHPVKLFDSQAECYATYLIHLLENKIILPQDVNKALLS